MANNISSDTPIIFLGGPLNRIVEDWGGQPRGRMAMYRDFMDNQTHQYVYRFLPSLDTDRIDLVIADYIGVEDAHHDV